VANLLLSKGEEYGQKLEKGMQGQVLSLVYILPVWGKLSIWQSIPAFKSAPQNCAKIGTFWYRLSPIMFSTLVLPVFSKKLLNRGHY